MLQTCKVSGKSPKQVLVSQTTALRSYTHPEIAVRARQFADLRLVAHITQTLHHAVGRIVAREYAKRYAIGEFPLGDDVAIDTPRLQFTQLPQRGLARSQRRQIYPVLDTSRRIDTAHIGLDIQTQQPLLDDLRPGLLLETAKEETNSRFRRDLSDRRRSLATRAGSPSLTQQTKILASRLIGIRRSNPLGTQRRLLLMPNVIEGTK